MISDRQRGFVLYFDGLNALSNQVAGGQISAEDAFSVIAALGQYAQTGEEPAAASLSPVASMAFALMVGGVRDSLEKYAEKKKKTRAAAQARWSGASEASESMQTDADAQETVQQDASASGSMRTEGIDIESTSTLNQNRLLPPEERRDDVDPVRFSEDMDALEGQWRRMGLKTSQSVYAWFESLMAGHSVDDILRAMQIADKNGARNPRPYVERCLASWKSGGGERSRDAPSFDQKGGPEFYDGFEVYE